MLVLFLKTWPLIAATAALAAVAIAPALADQGAVQRRELRAVSEDGVEIRVREIVPEGAGEGEPIVLIHGARVPGIGSFDLPVPHGSFAADLAQRLKRRVYVMDARGYGGSARPAAMAAPAAQSKPLSRAFEVVRDIKAVADLAQKQTGQGKVALLGWATGGMWATFYASLFPEKVGHLVALNALYGGSAPHPYLGPQSPSADPNDRTRLNPKLGGYAIYESNSLLPNWDSSIPVADKDAWRDPHVAEAYVEAALASDPLASERQPRAFRAPLGAIEDSFYQANGRRLFDASSITAHLLIVRADRDFWSRPEDAQSLARDAVRAASVSLLTLEDATHFVHLDRPERGRERLLNEVAAFFTRD